VFLATFARPVKLQPVALRQFASAISPTNFGMQIRIPGRGHTNVSSGVCKKGGDCALVTLYREKTSPC
jgi:hypothetical protein